MPVAYPSTLPLPLLDKTREQPAAFQMAQPRRGFGYVEPTGTDTPMFWGLTWRFTTAQAQTFIQWFRVDLERGTLPFDGMPILTEAGLEEFELQFLPDSLLPARHIGGGVWEYSATVTARDTEAECFLETFDEGLAPYTDDDGDIGIFSVIDGVLHIDAQSGGSAYVQRACPVADPVVTFSGRVRITAPTTDDSCGAYLYTGGGTLVAGFQPRSPVGGDALQRATFQIGSDTIRVGSAAIVAGEWYRWRLTIATGAGQSFGVITRESNGLSSAEAFTLSHSPATVASLRFFIDSSATTAETDFDSVRVCPH